ncbi:hypothetical protein IVY21_20670 [Salmonella enterica subsp. enterica serovar Worthington]|nr:hypothetical protein [Salmonella enterica subsp. enterica serovar Worthington]
MPPLFTINACKSAGCRNLGLPDSPDYVWPDYRPGYPALHCRACGSYPPLFNEGNFAAGRLLISRNMPKSMVTFAPIAIKNMDSLRT